MGWITFVETANASVSTPASGKDQLFFDTSDSFLKAKNSAGTVRTADNSVYRTLIDGHVHLGAGITSGTFVCYSGGGSVKSGADIGTEFMPIHYLVAADYGSGIKLRLRYQVLTNAIAPGTITFTGGLYPVTVAGAASTFIPTLGTVVSGSTVVIANPSASSVTQSNSGDFTFPTDGAYCFGYTTNATTAATSFSKCSFQLQAHNV